MNHHQVWAAVDALAANRGLTASGLAIKAGLDATSFNKSKRISKDGRERWPSTETVSKIIKVAEINIIQWATLVDAMPSKPVKEKPYERILSRAVHVR